MRRVVVAKTFSYIPFINANKLGQKAFWILRLWIK